MACYASSFPCLYPAAQISPMLSAMTDRIRVFSQERRCWKMQPQAALPALILTLLVKWPTGLKPAALHTVLLPRKNSPPPVSLLQKHQPATSRCKTGHKSTTATHPMLMSSAPATASKCHGETWNLAIKM